MNFRIQKQLAKLTNFSWRNMFRTARVAQKRYDLPQSYDGPVYDMEKLHNTSKVLLIRHGNTLFNLDEL